MKIVTENDDEYYENMIRADKRVDPKEEIAELKKRYKAIYEVLHTAHRYLLDKHLHEARVLDEVCKLLNDLNENPEDEGYGKQLADNIVARVANKVVPPEDPNQTQISDWEQRQSQERPVRQRPILGNRILTPVREEPASDPNVIVPMPQGGLPQDFMANYNDQHSNDLSNHRNPYNSPDFYAPNTPPITADNLARAQRIHERRAERVQALRDRNTFLESHRDIVERIASGEIDVMDLRGTRYTGHQINWLSQAAFDVLATRRNPPGALSDSPLNDAARENQARMERTCRFGGVDCEHEATVMNEHGTPMCNPCSERDYHARGNNPSYEILPLIHPPDPTR